jgi:hypothetical protein
MEVIRTTDIGVSDRGAVRGGFSARAIQTILENGMQGCVGMGVDLKRTRAGGIQTVTAECFGQFDHTKAASIRLFWMAPFAHDHIDKHLGVWSDAHGLLANALRRPIDPELMMCGHVIADRGMLAVARGSGVGGDALPLKIYLYGACGDPRP